LSLSALLLFDKLTEDVIPPIPGTSQPLAVVETTPVSHSQLDSDILSAGGKVSKDQFVELTHPPLSFARAQCLGMDDDQLAKALVLEE
jgi:hypothetical protein